MFYSRLLLPFYLIIKLHNIIKVLSLDGLTKQTNLSFHSSFDGNDCVS